MGGLDIFYSKRQSTNRWGEPQNIGYPINTHADEMGWTVSADGTTAYLAADSSLSQGSHKIIYQILLPEVIQPQPATPLQLLSVQDTIHLHHIYFDFDKSSLKPESESELRQLVKLINTYPDKTYTITGHTDNVGNEEYNRILSRQRAETIVNYLIQHGINPNILKYQGMGSSEPIESNSTEWGRSKNRRIEVSIQ
jgi:outer membrane protein OmpA-like peptidoglycan-associated protein